GRVLVCVGPSPLSARLIRSARRLAASLRAKLVAVYVETPGVSRLSEADRRRVEENLRLAEGLGAATVTLGGPSMADEVLAYATAHNVTKIVVGKPVRPRWKDVVFGSVVDDLIRRSGDINIYVIRGEADPVNGAGSRHVPGAVTRTADWAGYAWAAAVVATTTALGWPLYHRLDISNANVLMLYLLGVLWVATHHSREATVLCSVLAVAAFDLVFVSPHYTFAVYDRRYLVVFGGMLATALVISALTHRVRVQAEAARQRERRTAALLGLSRDLATARASGEIVAATGRHVADVLGRPAVVLLADGERRLMLKQDAAGPAWLDEKEAGVAQWAFEHDQPAGRGTDTLPASAGTYVPMRAPRGVVGVIGVVADGRDAHWSGERRQLVEAFASQAALAVERANLADEARAAWERVEAEFLRNTLLSGVSHELRTPLAGITGAASTLAVSGDTLPADARREMIDTIQSEADRMERLISNLLDMTRMEAGGLALKKEWLPLQEVVGAALHHLDNRLRGRDVNATVPADLPLVAIDGTAIEQVLTNLIDNAVEYTPPGTPVDITATAGDREITVEVSDRGPGLPPGTEKRVFEKFFRAGPAATRRGIGLGLAICRGIVEAHGGTITARNLPQGGAAFRFTLPRDGTPPKVDTSE
ncbi:MAG: Osmosensitive K+ channel histidine kinase KdpD, partial [uncultured Phycisphaerae bacterium]